MRYAKVMARVIICMLIVTLVSIMAFAVSAPTTNEYNQSEVSETTIAETTEPTQEQLINDPILFPEVRYIAPINYDIAIDEQNKLKDHVVALESAITSELYSAEAIASMNDEIGRLTIDINLFQADIDAFNKWKEEYPAATEVWFYLRNQGYSEEVTSGIIGNMMIETSGGTLNLKPTIYDPPRAFYGLCQWSLYYYPEARDLDMYAQLDLLMNTIQGEFKNFGFCYRSGFTYDNFLALESPEEVALAFAKVYERCSSGSYGARQRSARVAYEYFTNKDVM